MTLIFLQGEQIMKKIVFLPITVLAFMMLCPAAGFAATEEFPAVSPLLAGQDKQVGEVRVWNDDMNVYVKYVITNDDWCITMTHLAVEENLNDIPQTKAGPIPGLFDYSGNHECETEILYTVPLPLENQVYIAAHAVVASICGEEDPDLDGFCETLTASATLVTTDPFEGGPAYFPNIDVDAGADPLTGDYKGWCVSTSLSITEGVLHNANVYCSYDYVDGLVDYPENLDLINWILNQDFVYKPTSCNPALPTYTYGSVQRAIWSLIDDENSTLSLGSYSLCQIEEIIEAAFINGEGFMPDCGDFVGVLLEPFTPEGLPAQPVIIPVPLPCDPIFCDETAWGDGTSFVDKKGKWATYITYSITEAIDIPAGIELQ
jgi:hypothetical protein